MSELLILPYDSAHDDQLVPMWRASFEQGVGVRDPHPLAEQRAYLHEQVVPGNTVRLAFQDGLLVGFLASNDAWIAQLYVRVGCQRQGIGTRLLDLAKAGSAGSLRLHTFERNQGARAFYERHGFRAIAHGFEPTWQLADVTYLWGAG